jgi:hypothetical protein
MSSVHFFLQGFEVIRHARLGFRSHPLPGPLFEPVKLLVDIHDAVRKARSLDDGDGTICGESVVCYVVRVLVVDGTSEVNVGGWN